MIDAAATLPPVPSEMGDSSGQSTLRYAKYRLLSPSTGVRLFLVLRGLAPRPASMMRTDTVRKSQGFSFFGTQASSR